MGVVMGWGRGSCPGPAPVPVPPGFTGGRGHVRPFKRPPPPWTVGASGLGTRGGLHPRLPPPRRRCGAPARVAAPARSLESRRPGRAAADPAAGPYSGALEEEEDKRRPRAGSSEVGTNDPGPAAADSSSSAAAAATDSASAAGRVGRYSNRRRPLRGPEQPRPNLGSRVPPSAVSRQTSASPPPRVPACRLPGWRRARREARTRASASLPTSPFLP